MRSPVVFAGGLLATLLPLLGGCSGLPDLPSESVMPVQEIMLNAVCELRSAFTAVSQDPRFPKFKASEWAAAIVLTPRVDAEVAARLGATGKRSSSTSATRNITWTLGTSPGVELDIKGHRDSAVTFTVHTSQLLDATPKLEEACPQRLTTVALTHYLGIYEWLERIIPEAGGALETVTGVDKPVFNSQVIIKYDGGNAGPTWFIPNGSTYSATVFAARTEDMTLGIGFTPDPKKKSVNTLPENAPITKRRPSTVQAVSPAALNRLDQIMQEETFRNLRIQIQ